MKRKMVMFLCAVVLVLTACTRRDRVVKPGPSEFRDVVTIKTTPVKNQGPNGSCWIYGVLATLESERLMLGDSVNLSVDYLMRMLLLEEAHRAYFDDENRNMFVRGMMPRALDLIHHYGLMPYESYHYGGTEGMEKAADYQSTCYRIRSVARACWSLKKLDERVNELLDYKVDYLPRVVFMQGAEYTPQEFGHSVCMPGDWQMLTSFSHQPFFQPIVLECTDNQQRDTFLNLPLDTMMVRLDRSLHAGHPVGWEGDIGTSGFDWTNGRATLLGDKAAYVDQQNRQREYELHRTRDGHVMEICGIARDHKGRKFYKLKNSWGTDNRYHGYIYFSEAYMRARTVALMVRAE